MSDDKNGGFAAAAGEGLSGQSALGQLSNRRFSPISHEEAMRHEIRAANVKLDRLLRILAAAGFRDPSEPEPEKVEE